jgi:hypothetical protein
MFLQIGTQIPSVSRFSNCHSLLHTDHDLDDARIPHDGQAIPKSRSVVVRNVRDTTSTSISSWVCSIHQRGHSRSVSHMITFPSFAADISHDIVGQNVSACTS